MFKEIVDNAQRTPVILKAPHEHIVLRRAKKRGEMTERRENERNMEGD